MLGLAGRRPSDLCVGAPALVELLLVVQVVVAIVAPLAGNPPTGNLLEFWVYLVSAALHPARRGVLGAHGAQPVEHGRRRASPRFAVAVMFVRMQIIWTMQVA